MRKLEQQRAAGRGDFPRVAREPTIQLLRSETVGYVPAPTTWAERRRGSENTTALIVLGLTLACTALAIFDLFLLASGF